MDRHFLVQPPSPAIAASVHEIWDFQRPGDGTWHSGAPKPFVELVFNLDAPFDWRSHAGAPHHRFANGWLTPLQSGARQARPDRDIRLVGARLYPAAALLNFGPLPPGDGAPPLAFDDADPWFAATYKALVAAAGPAERLGLLDAAIADRIDCGEQAFIADANADNVAALSAQLGCPERELRRRFQRAMGIAPKRWLRLARIDRVLRDADLGNPAITIADIAHRHNFADQAHLAREFRLLIGQPADALRHGVRADPTSPPHFLG